MLSIELQIQRFQLTERMRRSLMREINRQFMVRHVAERLPKHFTDQAYAEYGARRRGTEYDKYKKRKFGHTWPNVRTGSLKKNLRHKITATHKGSKLVMRSRLIKLDEKKWANMTPEEKRKYSRKQRRLAGWQKREIAKLSKNEIRQERKRQAKEYRKGALSLEYKRVRKRRVK
jgi:hypothetical protein